MIIAAVEIRLAEAERVELLDQFWMVPSPGNRQSGARPELGQMRGGGLRPKPNYPPNLLARFHSLQTSYEQGSPHCQVQVTVSETSMISNEVVTLAVKRTVPFRC